MFQENRNQSRSKKFVLVAALLMCPCAVLAQRGTGGMGGGLAGGGGLSGGNGMASGLDTKDDLKGFHDLLAMQATKPQVGQFRLMLKSTEAAASQLQALKEQAGKGNQAELTASAKSLSAAMDQARSESEKFLEGLSDRQKSGMRESVRKVSKTDAELGQEIKTLDAEIAAGKLGQDSFAENVKTTLITLRDEQRGLGDEMSISADGNDGEGSFSIAPVKIVVPFENQPIVVSTSGVVSRVTLPGVANTFQMELSANLSDLQQNMTEVLRQQLSKSDPCGEQIAIQMAALTPSTPVGTVLVQLHYERWACFGGRGNANEMAEGNGSIEVTLTPTIAEDGTLRVSPAISRVDAEGLVGDLLRSGTLGETVRDAIAATVLAAVRQGADYKAILPASAQGYVKLQRAKFEAVGAGELSVVLDGSMQVPSDKVAAEIEAELAGVKSGANAAPSAAAQASQR